MSTSKKVSKFVAANLKKLNKTEKEVQQEKIERFVEDAIIEAETQIAIIKTSTLPILENELKRLEINLKREKDNFEEARFSVANSFTEYVSKRERVLDEIDGINALISHKKEDSENAKAELATLESILEDLK